MKHKCPRCKRSFPQTLEYFYRNRSKVSGLCIYCKPCQNAINIAWRRLNQEKVRESQRRYNKLHPYKRMDPAMIAERESRERFEAFLIRLNQRALAAR